jgi:hypothetical protein
VERNVIKVGDKVRTVGYFKGVAGIVEAIYDWSEGGPLSVENHGIIEVRVESVQKGTRSAPRVGEIEHYVVYEWWKTLEIISD